MKNILAFILMCLATSLVHAQTNKPLNYPKELNGDTAFWYSWNLKLGAKLGLNLITDSKSQYNFRLWMEGQIIDVQTSNYKDFTAALVNYIEAYVPYGSKRKPAKSIIYIKTLLDSASARRVYYLAQTIASVPTQDSIPLWKSGCDGGVDIFETYAANQYAVKEYWSPEAYSKRIPEALQIQKFIDKLNKELRLRERYNNFTATLPLGSYRSGMMILTKSIR